MEDRAYMNAQKRRKELVDELEEIDQFLILWKRYSGTEPEQTELPVRPKPFIFVSPTVRKPKLSPDDLALNIKDVILANGRPMARGALVNAVILGGIKIGGIDKSRNMGTIMWRMKDRFINIKGEGYWPRDVPCEAVGYDPETAPKHAEDMLS